jgi:hypothetical protein
MIKFFRKIRQNLLSEGKTGKYIKYAIGEIILVVVGILIALSINTWSQNVQNKRKEVEHLSNLILDLKADSLRLSTLENSFKIAVQSKRVFEDIIDGRRTSMDSININFTNQYNFVSDFVPNSITINELKNSSSLNLITNVLLRRKIVKLYNSYEDLEIKIQLGTIKAQEILDIASSQIKNISSPTEDEVAALIKSPYFTNKIKMNYLYTQLATTTIAFNNCKETIELINKELSNY